MTRIATIGAFVWHWRWVLDGLRNGNALTKHKRHGGFLMIGCKFRKKDGVLIRQRRPIYIAPDEYGRIWGTPSEGDE